MGGTIRIGLAAAGFCFCCLGACSALTDLNGLSGGSPNGAGSSIDGSSESGSGSSSSSSSSSSSGGTDSDSGVLPDGGKRALCDRPGTEVLFCDDFSTTQRNDVVLHEAHGQVTFIEGRMETQTDAPAAERASAVLIVKNDNAGKKVHLEMDIRALAHSATYTETIMLRSIRGSDANRCVVFLLMTDNGWKIHGGCPFVEGPFLGAIRTDETLRLVIDVESGGLAKIALGERTAELAMSTLWEQGSLELFAGIYYAQDGTNEEGVALDNLVLTKN